MKYKPGDILFLTVRPWSLRKFHRVLLSKLIEYFSGKFVHCAIIYEYDNTLFVREMDFSGNKSIKLSIYLDMYNDRIKKVNNLFRYDYFSMQIFNSKCHYSTVKYDYKNLFIYQLIKHFFNKWFWKNTIIKRTCSEDVCRMLNVLNPGFISNPDCMTPTELYYYIVSWQN